jgi:hypothetical protein
MKKIVSFGDSFVFGSEQKQNYDGSLGWVGRAATSLGVEYETLSVPGCGNDHIARQIYSYFENNPVKDTLAVINWTWGNRWDFYISQCETWITLGPTCVPEKLKDLVSRTEAQDMIDFYKNRANSSILWNKFRNLQTMFAVQSYLKSKNITNIQTYMDYMLFDREHNIHSPDYVQVLQNLVKPDLVLFEGQNFIDWSYKNGFEVTELGLHPLEDAHIAACNLWIDRYAQALNV